jgi:PAS domain S-box-containing protein
VIALVSASGRFAADRNTALLAAAVDTGPAAVLVTDRGGHVVAANATACEVLGYTREELLGANASEFVVATDGAQSRYADLLERGEQKGLIPVRHRDGRIVMMRYSAARVHGSAPELYVSVSFPRRTIAAGATPQQDAARRPRSRDRTALSAREFEILALLAEGQENDEIARTLHLALDTVKAHVSRVLQKLGARSRTHAVALALRSGLID